MKVCGAPAAMVHLFGKGGEFAAEWREERARHFEGQGKRAVPLRGKENGWIERKVESRRARCGGV